MRNVGMPTRETRIVAPKALLAVSSLRLPDSATGGGRLRLQTCLRDFIPINPPFCERHQWGYETQSAIVCSKELTNTVKVHILEKGYSPPGIDGNSRSFPNQCAGAGRIHQKRAAKKPVHLLDWFFLFSFCVILFLQSLYTTEPVEMSGGAV